MSSDERNDELVSVIERWHLDPDKKPDIHEYCVEDGPGLPLPLEDGPLDER